MGTDIVKPAHAWIMSKLIDKRSGSISVKDLIYELCDSALTDVQNAEDFNAVLSELNDCGYIKKPMDNLLTGFAKTEIRYEITEDGMFAFRLQIMRPISKICDEDIKVKEHLNEFKETLQHNRNNLLIEAIAFCLKNAAFFIEFVKYAGISIGA